MANAKVGAVMTWLALVRAVLIMASKSGIRFDFVLISVRRIGANELELQAGSSRRDTPLGVRAVKV